MSEAIDPIEAAVDAMDESGAFENGVFRVSRETIRSCFLAGLDAYEAACDLIEDGPSNATPPQATGSGPDNTDIDLAFQYRASPPNKGQTE